MKYQDVQGYRRIAVVTVIVTPLFTSVRVMKVGQVRHVISQTALGHLTALDVAFVMLLWMCLDVKTVLEDSWDPLVMIPAHTVFKYQWTAVTVFVSKDTAAWDATVSVRNMGKFITVHVSVMLDGEELYVISWDAQG